MKEYIVRFVPNPGQGDAFAEACETAINALPKRCYEIDKAIPHCSQEPWGILFIFRLTAEEREQQMYKKVKEEAARAAHKKMQSLQEGVRSTNIRRLEEI